MVQNINFRELFDQYEAAPPKAVWKSIALQIQPASKDRFWKFNIAQTVTIFLACIGSISFSSYLSEFIGENTLAESSHQTTISYSKPIQEIIETEHKFNHLAINKPKIQVNSSKNTQLTKNVMNANLAQNKMLKELIDIDKEILALVKEVKSESDKVEENSATTEFIASIDPIEFNQLPLSDKSIYLIEKELNTRETTFDEVVDVEKKVNEKRDIFYLLPYMGMNYTQVSYQSAPNSPYFSDKASFSGKFGYNIGVNAGMQLTKHWSIESGIGFGQYIQSFKETKARFERSGIMYIDQLDIPLLARYSFNIGTNKLPKLISPKAGFLYNSVLKYQVNYIDRDFSTAFDKSYQIEADKRQYNSLQLGYAFGFDFDAFLTNKLSVNFGVLNSLVSQLENFPLFNQEVNRPKQFTSTFSIGTKWRF